MEISSEESILNIESIHLDHMRLELSPGEILNKPESPQSAQYLALWVVQNYFWEHPIVKAGGKDRNKMQVALEQAKEHATRFFLENWKSLGERATIFILNDAQRTGWFSSSYFQYDSLESYIASRIDDSAEKSSSWWDYKFILEVLIPNAKAAGIDPRLLYAASGQVKKLRQFVPTAKAILKDANPGKEAIMEHFVEMIADPDISPASFKNATDYYRGKIRPPDEHVIAYQYNLPGNKAWFVIECDNSNVGKLATSIQRFAELRIADYAVIFQKMYNMLGDKRQTVANIYPELFELLKGNGSGD